MATSALPAAASAERAAHSLATIDHRRGVRHVKLPERFAVDAAEQFLRMHRALGWISVGPKIHAELGLTLLADQWAIAQQIGTGTPMKMFGTARKLGGHWVWIFAKYTISLLNEQDVSYLLRALEQVKPEECEADGRPVAWVPEPVERLGGEGSGEDDATEVGPRELLPHVTNEPADVAGGGPFISTDEIRRRFAELLKFLELPDVPLSVTRGKEHRHGLVTGKVWFDAAFAIRRIHITTCPSSDWAEILATMVHEIAHPAAMTKLHDERFKRTMIALAGRLWGPRYFVGAAAKIAERYRAVDFWVASGIRAALRDGDAPVAKDGDDGQMARVLARIKKLRELAQNQRGLPEGIAATGAANDLITMYGLDGYGVPIDGAFDDHMMDRWIVLEDGAVWRRMLAHGIAQYCEVFSLAIPGKGRMHFFGTRADVIAAEYIYSVSAARIERECREHLVRWKARKKKTTSAETVREKTSFCDCAVIEFRKKLEKIATEEGAGAETRGSRVLDKAEAFARGEHARRGSSWGSGGGKHYRENAAGRAAGRAMDVVVGVGGGDTSAPLRLSKKS